MERQLPNLMTLGNLFCGFLGILSVLYGDLAFAGLLVFIGAAFDVLDGLVARMLKVTSPMGKELDSLADMVTFGLLPSLIAHVLLMKTHAEWLNYFYIGDVPVASLLPFLIAGMAAWRLARFNTDTTQSKYFRGLPTPANGLFFASLPLILQNDVYVVRFDVFYLSELILNPYLLTGSILFMAWLMISPLRLFSFKFDNLDWRDNKITFVFLVISLLLFIFLLWAAVPLIIFLYLILSYFNKPKFDEVQSAD